LVFFRFSYREARSWFFPPPLLPLASGGEKKKWPSAFSFLFFCRVWMNPLGPPPPQHLPRFVGKSFSFFFRGDFMRYAPFPHVFESEGAKEIPFFLLPSPTRVWRTNVFSQSIMTRAWVPPFFSFFRGEWSPPL